MEMNARATKLQAAENDLKQLMANLTRAMEKAEEAIARIASNAAAANHEHPPERDEVVDSVSAVPGRKCRLTRDRATFSHQRNGEACPEA
jgi:Skp family chaperone for outer membrane proteins